MPNDPLILLPPEGADARIWGPVNLGLTMHGPVMVFPVHLGDRIEEMASELLTAAPARFALCGMGLGGMVAMEVMRRAADRVTRLALLDTSPHADTPEEAAARETRIIKAKTGHLGEIVLEDLQAAGLSDTAQRPQIAALAGDMADHLGPKVYERQARCLMRRRDQHPTLRRLACPTLVMCGAGNLRYPPKRHESMAELIPHATLRIVEAAGHLAPLEQPEAVIGALRDWQAVAAPCR